MKRELFAVGLLLACGIGHRPAQGQSAEPMTPLAHTFHDSSYGVKLQIPAGWSFAEKDGELSTFHLDARSAGRGTQLRAVAAIGFNPYPITTFSGALLYFSVRPRSTAVQCAAEASARHKGSIDQLTLDGLSFQHGHTENGKVCVETRDDVYTAMRGGVCYRFDLAMNTFCSNTSGSRDMTAAEIKNTRKRMESILTSITFTKP